MRLKDNTCVPCQGGIPPLDAKEATALLQQTPGWELIDNATRLRRSFEHATFMAALDFATEVGELAEVENHHPDICFGWGYCTVTFYTHKIGGLHKNDFIMAAKVNDL